MDWLQIMQTLGIPMGCLAAFSFAVWQALRWAAKNVAEPIVRRHVEFLVKVEAALEQQTKTLKDIADMQRLQEMELTKLRQLVAAKNKPQTS